jgi:glycosyltransferase 2 family protein
MGNKVRYIVTALLFILLVLFAVHRFRTSPEWQGFEYDRFTAALNQIDYRFLLLALVFIYSTYLLRAIRWREFLLPIKATSISNLLAATIIGFGGLALLGRPGELIRPYLISRKEELPVSTQMAVWLIERIYDLSIVIVLIGGVMYFSVQGQALGRQHASAAGPIRAGAIGLVVFTLLATIVMFLYRRYWTTAVPWLARRMAFLPPLVLTKVQASLENFGRGLSAIRTTRAFAMGLLYTVLIWASISVGYFLTLRAFGPPLSEFSFVSAVVVMGFAIGGSMLQVPGIGGGTQVFMILALTEVFQVRPEMATSASIILWLLTFVAVVPPAVYLLVREGLSLRKLRLLAASTES